MADFIPFSGQLDQASLGPGEAFVPFQGKVDQVATTPPKMDWRQQLLRQLGLAARSGITGVTGTGSALADAGVGLANLLGAKLPMPSQALQQQMTSVGLPQPQGQLEKAVNFGSTALAGGLDPLALAAQVKAAALAPQGFQNPTRQAATNVAQELHNAGYRFTPAELEGGTVSRTMQGIGGTQRLLENLQVKNQPVTQRLTTDALGLPAGTPITQDILKQQAKDLVETGYKPIEHLGQIGIGSQFRSDVNNVIQRFGGSNSFPLTKDDDVYKTAMKYLVDEEGRPLRTMTGFDAMQAIKNLRAGATDNFKPGGNSLLGQAQQGIANALENNIELNLRNPNIANRFPHMLDQFRTARTALAKNYAVGRMLTDPNTGVVSTTKAASQLASGVPLTDQLATIAKAGAPMYARATAPALHGVPPPINYGDSMLMSGALAGSPFTHGLSLLGAGIPIARSAARQALMSDPIQNILMRNMANQAPNLLQQRMLLGLPEQLAPLFSEGEQ